MPVPAYIEILDSEIDPNSPITTTLMTKLRDNMLAIIGGGVDAPRMETSLLAPGGSMVDGVLNDVTMAAITSPGFYDFEGGGAITVPAALPWFSVIRVRGDLTLSATLTVDKVPDDDGLLELMGLVRGNPGTIGVNFAQGSGGGAHHAAGGTSSGGTPAVGGAARSLTALQRWWLSRKLPCGGKGGLNAVGNHAGGKGGGVLVLIVDGDLTATGGGIAAPGGVGYTDPANDGSSGGGAAGTLIVICTGTFTAGTWTAIGGAGGARGPGGNSGGGSGGAVEVVADAYGVAPILTVTGGNGPGGATDGGAGFSEITTISQPEINGLLIR